jgi:hypothetical protein
MVASVQSNLSTSSTEFQSEPWIGGINLDEDHVKILRSMFKCLQCRTNNHTFPSCPLLKHWIIKKKVRSDSPPDTSSSGAVRSAVAPHVDSCQECIESPLHDTLDTIPESSYEEDFTCDVEFDLLPDGDSQDNVLSGAVYPYSVFKVPLGSVKKVTSFHRVTSGPTQHYHDFDVIIDSGCTRHMFCFRELFFSYKPCAQSFVILADKSKVPCLGIGCISMILGDKKVILHDVLHLPSLRCPLLSVRCF